MLRYYSENYKQGMKENSKFTLLAVVAHPDDETFGMGGTLALYAQRGVNVHLIMGTRGEAGEMDAKYMEGFNSIAERRVSELRCATQILGIQQVHFLDYRDSGMTGSAENQHEMALANTPIEDVAVKILYLIRKIRPQVILTFDPIGGYQHPDHIAIHRATVTAFHLAGDPKFNEDSNPYHPQKLYYSTFPLYLLRFGILLMRLFGQDPRHYGQNKDIDLVSLVQQGGFPTHARINTQEVAHIVAEATACHASQGGLSMSRGPIRYVRRLLGSQDRFTRAFPPAEDELLEIDLFSGVVPD